MLRHLSGWTALQRWERDALLAGYPMTLIPPHGKTINTYLPLELLREIFLYSVESHRMKPGHLAFVCRSWRSIIVAMSSLWSTLRVGTWTERGQVITWMQRAYTKKVVIDTQRDDHRVLSNTPFTALQNALTSTSQWHELTILSFPPDSMADQLEFQIAMPMKVLRILHVGAGCVRSPSFTHLLDLIPTEAPLSELRLHSSFVVTYFLRPHWFPVLQNITVLIVNGRDIHGRFDLLPAFTRLHTFEADRLSLPWYELDIEFPLLHTLRKMQLRASSIQWMAGRQFPCLEECAILLPHHKEAVELHGVEFPSCKKLTYHGYPMTTVQYFHVPKIRAMELRSHDCKHQRVRRQLWPVFSAVGSISNLTTLHFTLQCNEQAFIKVLKYLGCLRKLVFTISHPSHSWKNFLKSLASQPSTTNPPLTHQTWKEWHSSQTWRADILPRLKYLGVQCHKGFYQSDCLDNSLLFRLVGWTRAQLAPPLEHLKVWEGRRTTDNIVVDYTSIGYLEKHLGSARDEYDTMVVSGMITQRLVIHAEFTLIFRLHSTVLFRQLQDLKVICSRHEIPFVPSLEQIRRLEIMDGTIPAYPLNINLPLIHTLQRLALYDAPFSWMLGRTFKALREFVVSTRTPSDISGLEGLQVDLPACRELKLWDFSMDHLHFFSCPNVQVLRLQDDLVRADVDVLKSFLSTCSCLQELGIIISQEIKLDSLIQFVFCGARARGVWQDIRNVEVEVRAGGSWTKKDRNDLFSQMVGHQRDFDKWWKEFTVTKDPWETTVTVRASI